MRANRRTWNQWDVPYFGASASPSRSTHGRETQPALIRFFDAGSRVADRIWAVLLGVAAVVCGAALTGLLLVASFVLSWLSAPSRGEVAFAIGLGAAVAVIGIVIAVLSYRHAGRPTGIRVFADRLEIGFPAFRRPLVVPRDLVRAATIDAGTGPFDEGRFPIAGALPEGVFADALDNMPSLPWEDLDPDRQRWLPGVILESPKPPVGRPQTYEHDDPDLPGWGSSRSTAPPWTATRDAFLWSRHGSSLPFLRVHPGERPNLAILFHGTVPTPRPPWWFDFSPITGRRLSFRGGRAVRGFLLTTRDLITARETYERWGVLREITADDVLDEGLLVAKPLTGLRALVFAAIFLGGLLIDVLFRALR